MIRLQIQSDAKEGAEINCEIGASWENPIHYDSRQTKQ